jgi:tripeptide aminopeptidase
LEQQVAAMRRAIKNAVEEAFIEIDGRRHQASFEETSKREYRSFNIPESSPTYQLPLKAGQALGLKMGREISGGGSDANIFNEKGIESVIIGTGMQDVHTVKEHIRVEDMVNCTRLLLKMIELHS